jgi:hypothetical protein
MQTPTGNATPTLRRTLLSVFIAAVPGAPALEAATLRAPVSPSPSV